MSSLLAMCRTRLPDTCYRVRSSLGGVPSNSLVVFAFSRPGGVSKTSSMFPSASRGVGSHRRFKPTHVLAPSHPESSVLLAGRLHRTTSLYPLSAGNAEAMTSKNLGPVLALDCGDGQSRRVSSLSRCRVRGLLPPLPFLFGCCVQPTHSL